MTKDKDYKIVIDISCVPKGITLDEVMKMMEGVDVIWINNNQQPYDYTKEIQKGIGLG